MNRYMTTKPSLALIVSALVFSSISSISAQQVPVRSNWNFNYFQENPAVAGAGECLELKAGYRQMWAGIDGAPTTSFMNINGLLFEDGDIIHGIGGRVVEDKAGPYSFTAVNVAYSINMQLNRKWRIAAGAAVGFAQYRLALGDLVMPDLQAGNDPAIQLNSSQILFPTIDFGIHVHNRYTFYGLSIQHLTGSKVSNWGLDTELQRHVGLYGGSSMEMNENVTFRPSGMIKLTGGSVPSVDLVGMFDFRGVVQAGLGYRSGSAMMGLITFDVFDYVTIAYAYDWNVSGLATAAPSTHEIVIGVKACSSRRRNYIPCAAFQ
jgi:type IX secretion system PorP/SprF family membrane protein